MKKLKSLAVLLIITLAIILSSLPVCAVGESAPLKYSSVYNSGTRHVVCTTLDGTSADEYYTGSYTYEALSELTSRELYKSLNTLMTSTHKKKTSYNDCRDMAVKTDCEGGDGRINLIYASVSVTRSDYISGSVGWNREHVWPQSLGGFGTSGAGSDLHHIRPSDAKLNSTRGNLKYGNVTGGKTAVGSSLVNSMVGGWVSGGYFEPLDNVKGDVARICLYVYVRYGTEYSKCSSITTVFRDIDTLLEWCALDPVDTWEMGRNEVVGAIQGNRNVFIDYPEYAWLLFGEEVPEDLVTPTSASREGTDPDDNPVTPPDNGDDDNPVTPPDNGDDNPVTPPDNGDDNPVTPPDNGDDNPVTPPDNGDDNPVTPPECSHPSTSLIDEKTATCTSDGYTGDICCDECGKILSYGEQIHMIDHSFKKTGETEDGMQEETCTVCGFTRTVPKEAKNLWETLYDFFKPIWDLIISWFAKMDSIMPNMIVTKDTAYVFAVWIR